MRKHAPVKIIEAPVRAYIPTSLPPGSIHGGPSIAGIIYYLIRVTFNIKNHKFTTSYPNWSIFLFQCKIIPNYIMYPHGNIFCKKSSKFSGS